MRPKEFQDFLEKHPEVREKGLIPFKPILDRIIVHEEPIPEQQVVATTAQGAIVQSQFYQKERTYRGVVVAVGDGVPMGGVIMPMPYQVGDHVRLGEFGGDRFYLHPEHEFSKDKSLPIYWSYRVADTLGKDLA